MEKAAHHKQKDFCYKRPTYREPRYERAVKVYTINQESRYLLVQGVPTVGASKELIERFALYGDIEEYRLLDEYPCEEFTEAYWVKYKRIASAKHGKRKMDNMSFFGGLLHVCYAPEYESVDDTRQKIKERRIKCRNYNNDKKRIESDVLNEENSAHSIVEKRKKQWQYKDDKILQHKTPTTHEVSPSAQSTPPSCNSNLEGENIDSELTEESPLPPPITKHNFFASTRNQHQNLSVSQDKSLPRLPSKNATLPVELQNLQASDVYSVHYNDVIRRSSVPSREEINFDKKGSINDRDNTDTTQTNHVNNKPNNISRKKTINWLKRPHTTTSTSNSPYINKNSKEMLQQRNPTTVYQYSQAPGPENPFKTHSLPTSPTEKDSFQGTVQSIQEKLRKTSEVQQRGSSHLECPLQAASNDVGLMLPNVIAKKKRNDGRKRI